MLKPEDIVVDIANYPTRGMLLGIPVGVRITHKPTGISVVEDSECSQHRNREVALRKLEKMVAEAQPAPMSDDNRKVAYAAADKLRKLGYRWDEGIGDWVRAAEPASPTAGMNLVQRILHVGGRNNAAGYVEFGSIQAVEALVKQVLRDQPTNLCASAVNKSGENK